MSDAQEAAVAAAQQVCGLKHAYELGNRRQSTNVVDMRDSDPFVEMPSTDESNRSRRRWHVQNFLGGDTQRTGAVTKFVDNNLSNPFEEVAPKPDASIASAVKPLEHKYYTPPGVTQTKVDTADLKRQLDAALKKQQPPKPATPPPVLPPPVPASQQPQPPLPTSKAASAPFQPDYTPEQLENLGVYDALYRGQGPRLASLGEWKPEWISEHDPKGWAQWYKRYASGRRIEGEDERQIKRWVSFKARHGGPFAKNPTPRRGWALRNWGIDPSKLVDKEQAQTVTEMLDEYQRKAMQKYVQEKVASNAARRLFTKLMKDTAAGNISWHGTSLDATKKILNSEQLQPAMHGAMTLSRHIPLTHFHFYNNRSAGTALGFNRRMPEYRASGVQGYGHGGRDRIKEEIMDKAIPKPWRLSSQHISRWSQPMDHTKTPHIFGDAPVGPIQLPAQRGVLRYAFKTDNAALNAQLQRHGARLIPPKLQQHFTSTQLPYLTATRRAIRDIGSTPWPKGTLMATRRDVLRHLNDYFSQQNNGTAHNFLDKLRQMFSNFSSRFKFSAHLKQAELLPEIQLQEHQQRIADRVSSEDPRMLVYHGLGSGKSLSALAAAEAAKQKYQDDYGIVVPASLRGNFQKEVQKFTRNSNPEIMSYTGLGLGKKFQQQPDTVIMDEAHRLRNPDAASSRAAQQVAQNAKRLLLLTGSPVTNSPADLAGLLTMLENKQISPEEFEKRYVGYQKVSPGWFNWLRGVKPGEKPYVKNEQELRDILRGKVDYQPSKTPEGVNVNEEVIRVPLSAEQQKIQKAIRTKIPPGFLWKLDQEFPLSRDELAKLNSFLTGLRQVSLSTQPFRADKDPAKAFGQSAKLQTAMKNLQQVLDSDPRKKAIIYSNFIDSGLRPYSAALEKAQIPHGVFHGSIPVKQRLQALKDYNEGRLRALLLGPAAAEGISTKGTSLIQLLDPHWHESRSQQARGRGLRFDSHRDLPEELKNVAVQRYISSSEDPSWLGKWLGYKRERTGDEVLEHLTADKERLNEEFRKILREVGTKK